MFLLITLIESVEYNINSVWYYYNVKQLYCTVVTVAITLDDFIFCLNF